jgi:DNA-binding CsgD family transcriptional regulator
VKKPRRTDGICPTCNQRPRFNHSYCAKCNNERRRAERAGSIPKAQPPVLDEHGMTWLQGQILRYMCQGLESSQIAARTGYSLNYVKQRRGELLTITGCINSHHLTAWAALRGYAQKASQEISKHYSVLNGQNSSNARADTVSREAKEAGL